MKGAVPCMKRVLSAARVATNGRDQVFVVDAYNDCIQMLTLEGHYMGTASRVEDPYLGTPSRVDWCKNTSSLVVAHSNQSKVGISKIQIDADQVQRLLAESLNKDAYSTAQARSEVQIQPLIPEAGVCARSQPSTSEAGVSGSVAPPGVTPLMQIDLTETILRGDSTAGITYKGDFLELILVVFLSLEGGGELGLKELKS